MSRADISYARDLALKVSMRQLSGDSATLSLSCPKKTTDYTSRASATEGRRAPKDSGLVPSHLDEVPLEEPAPSFEYSEHLPSLEYRRRGSGHSANITANSNSNEPPSLGLAAFPEAHEYRSQRVKTIKPKVNIKPMLRKMSRDDTSSTSIDLSRSSTEQEGLGIYMNFDRDRRQSDSLTGAAYRRNPSGLHERSTSGTSQYSIAAGFTGSKQGSQYVYPMRPTPRAYTPSLSQTYQTSGNESDSLEGGSPDTESQMPGLDTSRPAHTPSAPVSRLSLQIGESSFTRLPGLSQTNLASRPSFGYSRDNGSTLDTASPSSRTSLDHVFRSRTRTSTDPVTRAATIQAARQAFEEKEAAKSRRIEKQQIKAESRQTRRRIKRKLSGGPESLSAPSNDQLPEVPEKEKASKRVDTELHDRQQSTSWRSQSKSTWMLFVTWLRTRVFKFRRRLRKSK